MAPLIIEVVKLLRVGAVLGYVELGVKHDLQEFMFILLDNIVKRGIFDIGTPIGSHLRDFIFSGNSCLEELLVASDCTSNNVSIVASNAAVLEKIILRMFLVNILLD